MDDNKTNATSDDSLEIFCDPCQIDNEHILAVGYCEVCNERLCKTCNNVHRRLAATRDHVVVDKNSMPEKLPFKPATDDLPEKCLTHGENAIDYYCISHAELCCNVCVSKSHENCKDVKNINDYSKAVDMDQSLNELRTKMQELAGDVNKTLFFVQKSLKAVEINHETARSQMLKLKEDVFGHIEDIHGTLIEELDDIRESDINEILPYKNKCEAVKFDLATMETYFKGKVIKASYRQFLTLKKAEIKVNSSRDDLRDIRQCNLNVTRYHFDPDSNITNMKNEPDCFGTFDIKEDAIKSAYLVNTLHASDIEEEETCCITGMAIISKGYLVVVDNNNASIKLIDTDEDKILSKVTSESAPWDITAVSDNQVAITVPDGETVNFISVTEDRALESLQDKQINVNGSCYGIICSNEKLFITLNNPSKLEVYNTSGKRLSSIDLDAENPRYISMNAENSKLYVSDDARGHFIQELAVDNLRKIGILDSCRDEVIGMAVDMTNVMYYCDTYSHVIDTVRLNRTQASDRNYVTLISEFSSHPKCVAFCDETNRLFVGMDGNEIAVYHVI